jgi:hypothetical protein
LAEVGLSNAYPACPTDDGDHFRAPKAAELKSSKNRERLQGELREASARCPGRLRVIALGGKAASVLQDLQAELGFELCRLPHPSAQGLLQAAPGKGKGLKLSDLQEAWERRLSEFLH